MEHWSKFYGVGQVVPHPNLQVTGVWLVIIIIMLCTLEHTRGRVIGVSVRMCVCGHKNEHFEQNKAVCELYLLRTSQKSSFCSTYPSQLQEAEKSRL